MRLARVKQLARLAGGFRRFLQTPVTHDQAVADIRRRMENRDGDFVALAKKLIYDLPASPYRKLLLRAGCEHNDLADSVRACGIEKTLEKLHDAGVCVSLDEFKAREGDFDNPYLGGHRYEATTSGSRGKSMRVSFDWEFLAEESAHELLLYEMHGVLDAPTAIWFPMPPGVAGIGNLLFNLKMGRPPEKWFSHTRNTTLEGRLALWLLRCRPEFADLSCAGKVVAWLADAKRRRGCAVVRSYGSSVVRIAETALETGTDISGCVLFSGGEPLTEHRKRFIESTGAKVFPRYISAETGLVAAACPNCASADDMHFYSDRLAVIQRDRSFLYTSLTPNAGKIMLNTELGDCGDLATKRCSCLFGELGFDLHMSNVRSNERITVEGMTVMASELHDAISAIIERPDSFQVRQTADDHGLNKIVIAVSPDVKGLDEAKFIRTVLENLQRGRPGNALASDLWRQADTFRVVREEPRLTDGHKLPGLR